MRPVQLAPLVLSLPLLACGQTNTNLITRENVMNAEKLMGFNFSEPKIDMMLPGLEEQLKNFEALRKFPLSNSVPPALLFNPIPKGMKIESAHKRFKMTSSGKVKLPADLDDLAYYS